MTSILSDTFAPPRIGDERPLRRFDSAMPRYFSSSSIRKPAAACGSSFAMPSVDACARCAEPNASFT